MKKIDAVCFGLAVTDLLITGFNSEVVFSGDLTRMEGMELSVGGDALNEASVLASLGYGVSLMSRLGDDLFARHVVETIEKRGVQNGMAIQPGQHTGLSIVLIRPDGQRHFAVRKWDETLAVTHAEDLDMELIEQAKVVSYGSLFTSGDLDSEKLVPILRKAQQAGTITCADIMMELGASLEQVEKALPYLDYMLPSLEEAAYYTGQETPSQMAQVLLEKGVGTVIIKMGGEGVFVKNTELEVTLPAFAVPVVDTTGAGDNFVAGFISGLIDDLPLLECVRRGNGCGAISVQQVGASAAVKSKQQLLDFLAAHA
ncbi:sugar kinase [Oscillospiraceae bacterium MB08-C2-2]|nr:sugar kinase [Oscillospiraceae bacterium MB08-C2-2]